MINYTDLLKATPNGVFATQDGQCVKTRVGSLQIKQVRNCKKKYKNKANPLVNQAI